MCAVCCCIPLSHPIHVGLFVVTMTTALGCLSPSTVTSWGDWICSVCEGSRRGGALGRGGAVREGLVWTVPCWRVALLAVTGTPHHWWGPHLVQRPKHWVTLVCVVVVYHPHPHSVLGVLVCVCGETQPTAPSGGDSCDQFTEGHISSLLYCHYHLEGEGSGEGGYLLFGFKAHSQWCRRMYVAFLELWWSIG